jgi:ADP-heptose:LPS heptosyltransferase
MDPRLDPAPGRAVRLIARLARSLLPLPESRPEPQDIHSVLVVRTDDRVGNVLLTLPLVRALQRALPHARVDFLIAARRAAVVEGLGDLHLVRFERRSGPLAWFRFLRDLRARYDVAIDAAHWHAFSLTSALLSRWAARRWTVGADRGPARLVYGGIAPPPPPGATDVSAKLLLAAPLGLRLSPSPLETALGRGPSPVSGRFVALNPGARKQDHRWPAGRFAALAKRLEQTHGIRSIVFWGPGEEPLAQEVVAEAHGSADLAPPTNLDQLAAAFRAAALVVTNDTGPMHLAVACGAPVVAVFLDAQGLRWAHPGARFEAVVAPADDAPLVAAAGRLLDRGRAPAQPAHTLEEPR